MGLLISGALTAVGCTGDALSTSEERSFVGSWSMTRDDSTYGCDHESAHANAQLVITATAAGLLELSSGDACPSSARVTGAGSATVEDQSCPLFFGSNLSQTRGSLTLDSGLLWESATLAEIAADGRRLCTTSLVQQFTRN